MFLNKFFNYFFQKFLFVGVTLCVSFCVTTHNISFIPIYILNTMVRNLNC